MDNWLPNSTSLNLFICPERLVLEKSYSEIVFLCVIKNLFLEINKNFIHIFIFITLKNISYTVNKLQ